MSELFGVSVVGREGRCSLNTLSVGGSPPPARDIGIFQVFIVHHNEQCDYNMLFIYFLTLSPERETDERMVALRPTRSHSAPLHRSNWLRTGVPC